MKFYQLSYFEESDTKDPSVQNFRSGYDVDSPNSATRIQFYEKINLDPEFDLVLDKNGRASDLLEPSFIYSQFLLVSTRFWQILKSVKILHHQYFTAILRVGDHIVPYHFLNFSFRSDSDENELVDFSKTKFFSKNTSFPLSLLALPSDHEGILGEFSVDSFGEYHSLRGKRENDYAHKIILPLDTLYLKKRSFLEFDLFPVNFGNAASRNFVVSERLAEMINRAELTGVKIDELSYEIALS